MEVCYKVSLCEYCQQQTCKAFIDLSICANMVHEERPQLCKNLAESDQLLQKMPISDQYSLVAPQP